MDFYISVGRGGKMYTLRRIDSETGVHYHVRNIGHTPEAARRNAQALIGDCDFSALAVGELAEFDEIPEAERREREEKEAAKKEEIDLFGKRLTKKERFKIEMIQIGKFPFGKHAKKEFAEIAKGDPGYINWWIARDCADDPIARFLQRALIDTVGKQEVEAGKPVDADEGEYVIRELTLARFFVFETEYGYQGSYEFTTERGERVKYKGNASAIRIHEVGESQKLRFKIKKHYENFSYAYYFKKVKGSG